MERSLSSLYQKDIEDIFEVRPIKDTYNQNETTNLYLIFKDEFDLSSAEAIHFQLLKDNTFVKYSFYQIEQRFNKINVVFDVKKGKYQIEFGFRSKADEIPTYFRTIKNITE